MFTTRKRIKQLTQKIEEMKIAKQELQKEKEELLKIKEMMENTNNPDYIDISDIHVWCDKGIYYLVRMEVKNITGRSSRIIGTVNGYHSILIDIFTNKIVYEKKSINKISSHEIIEDGTIRYYAHLSSIYDQEHNLLAYADKKVPRYILQQIYYRLNNVDLSDKILTK